MLLPKGRRADHQGKKYRPGDEIPEEVAKLLSIPIPKQVPKKEHKEK